jgi:hypothetical protein
MTRGMADTAGSVHRRWAALERECMAIVAELAQPARWQNSV